MRPAVCSQSVSSAALLSSSVSPLWLDKHEARSCYVLEVANPPQPGRAPGMIAVSAPFDLRPYAGKRMVWQADIRQEDVSVPPNHWNGVKCMLCFETPATGKHWKKGYEDAPC